MYNNCNKNEKHHFDVGIPGMRKCNANMTPKDVTGDKPLVLNHLMAEQAKSFLVLQELQKEVGTLLEFRNMVLEALPHLNQHQFNSTSIAPVLMSENQHADNSQFRQIGNGKTVGMKWVPGIRVKRKLGGQQFRDQDPLILSLIPKCRSNSQGKCQKNGGDTIEDSGFGTESSKDNCSGAASSTCSGSGGNNYEKSGREKGFQDDQLFDLLQIIDKKSKFLKQRVERIILGDDTASASTSACVPILSSVREYGNVTPCRINTEEKIAVAALNKKWRSLDTFCDIPCNKGEDNFTANVMSCPSLCQNANMHVSIPSSCNCLQMERNLLLAHLDTIYAEKDRLLHLLRHNQHNFACGEIGGDGNITGNERSTSSGVFLTGIYGTHKSGQSSQRQCENADLYDGGGSYFYFYPHAVDATVKADTTASSHESINADLFPITIPEKEQCLPFASICLKHVKILDKFIPKNDIGIIFAKNRTIPDYIMMDILKEFDPIRLQRHIIALLSHVQALTLRIDHLSRTRLSIYQEMKKGKDENEDLKFQLEEKGIQLEGTKAKVRMLERIRGKRVEEEEMCAAAVEQVRKSFENNCSTKIRKGGKLYGTNSNTASVKGYSNPSDNDWSIPSHSMQSENKHVKGEVQDKINVKKNTERISPVENAKLEEVVTSATCNKVKTMRPPSKIPLKSYSNEKAARATSVLRKGARMSSVAKIPATTTSSCTFTPTPSSLSSNETNYSCHLFDCSYCMTVKDATSNCNGPNSANGTLTKVPITTGSYCYKKLRKRVNPPFTSPLERTCFAATAATQFIPNQEPDSPPRNSDIPIGGKSNHNASYKRFKNSLHGNVGMSEKGNMCEFEKSEQKCYSRHNNACVSDSNNFKGTKLHINKNNNLSARNKIDNGRGLMHAQISGNNCVGANETAFTVNSDCIIKARSTGANKISSFINNWIRISGPT